mmetsp:Transcript_40432/g.126057  ORF Transcript_40432/g.126057 Transcript_40432/m.126057 type:complete len:254 (-) Transcript_40432:162-923(-)
MEGAALALRVLDLATQRQGLLCGMKRLAWQTFGQVDVDQELQGRDLHLWVSPLLKERKRLGGSLERVWQGAVLHAANRGPERGLALCSLVPNLLSQGQGVLGALCRIVQAVLPDAGTSGRKQGVHCHLLVPGRLEELRGLLEGLEGITCLILGESNLANGEEHRRLPPLVPPRLEARQLGACLLRSIVQLPLQAVGIVQEAQAVLLPCLVALLPEECQRLRGPLSALVAIAVLDMLLGNREHEGGLPRLGVRT